MNSSGKENLSLLVGSTVKIMLYRATGMGLEENMFLLRRMRILLWETGGEMGCQGGQEQEAGANQHSSEL